MIKHHLTKSFIIGQSFKMPEPQIKFSNLVTDKIQHQDSFYNVKYGEGAVNETMNPYYGAVANPPKNLI